MDTGKFLYFIYHMIHASREMDIMKDEKMLYLVYFQHSA